MLSLLPSPKAFTDQFPKGNLSLSLAACPSFGVCPARGQMLSRRKSRCPGCWSSSVTPNTLPSFSATNYNVPTVCQGLHTMAGCSVPLAAINDHPLSGLQRFKFILVQFGGSGIWKGSHWAQSEVSRGCIPSGCSGGESISWPFPASSGRPRSWASGPFVHLQRQQRGLSPQGTTSPGPCASLFHF